MRSNFAPLFEDVNIFGGKFGLRAGCIVLSDQARKMQRTGEASRPSADNQDIGVQSLSFHGHTFILADSLLECMSRPCVWLRLR